MFLKCLFVIGNAFVEVLAVLGVCLKCQDSWLQGLCLNPIVEVPDLSTFIDPAVAVSLEVLEDVVLFLVDGDVRFEAESWLSVLGGV